MGGMLAAIRRATSGSRKPMSATSYERRTASLQQPRLCVICPCYNEEEVVVSFYETLKRELERRCSEVEHRIVFVDDGSQDGTLEKLNRLASNDPQVMVYSLSRNFGHQIALSAGLDVARGDAVVLMDSDLQHPPNILRAMVDRWQEGYDVVSAVRQTTEDGSWFKRFSAAAFYRIFNYLSDVELVPGAADFVLLSRRAQNAIQRMPERHRFLRAMITWVGFPRAFVHYDAPARTAGKSKYSLFRMLTFAAEGLLAFSVKPIRLVSQLGLAVLALGLLYLLYVLGRFFIFNDTIHGWPSLMSAVLIIGGTQLLFSGLIGEYLARVHEQVKQRPLYLFKQEPANPLSDPAHAGDVAKSEDSLSRGESS